MALLGWVFMWSSYVNTCRRQRHNEITYVRTKSFLSNSLSGRTFGSDHTNGDIQQILRNRNSNCIPAGFFQENHYTRVTYNAELSMGPFCVT